MRNNVAKNSFSFVKYVRACVINCNAPFTPFIISQSPSLTNSPNTHARAIITTIRYDSFMPPPISIFKNRFITLLIIWATSDKFATSVILTPA